MGDELRVGDTAPAFELEGTDGQRATPRDWRGTRILLYFYPKDETTG